MGKKYSSKEVVEYITKYLSMAESIKDWENHLGFSDSHERLERIYTSTREKLQGIPQEIRALVEKKEDLPDFHSILEQIAMAIDREESDLPMHHP